MGFGRYYEDFTVGDVYEHRPGRTISSHSRGPSASTRNRGATSTDSEVPLVPGRTRRNATFARGCTCS